MIKYTEEIKAMNLWEKMSQISSEVEAVFKDMQVGGNSYGYKAVGVEQVITKVNDKMTKYGVVIYPTNQKINFIDEEVLKKDGTVGINRVVNAEIEYTVVNIHKPDEKIVTFGFAQGLDSGDKASGKANTYCYKYVLLRLFNIAVLNEDPDKTHSNDLNKNMYENTVSNKTLSTAQVNRLYAISRNKGFSSASVDKNLREKYGVSDAKNLTKQQYDEFCGKMEALPNK